MGQIWNKDNDTTEEHPTRSIHVGDLVRTVSEAHLYEHFKNVGLIASIKVTRFGYGYVNFLDAKDAKLALELLDHSNIEGKPCRITLQIHKKKSAKGSLFFKNVDLLVDHNHLRNAFGPYGHIISTNIVKNGQGHSKGFGFVHFALPAAASAAMDAFVKGEIQLFPYAKPATSAQARKKGKAPEPVSQLVVMPFVPKEERIQHRASTWTNLFVKNLNSSVTDQQLNKLFSRFGKITSSVVMKEDDGSSKCFGFVNFETHENAERAAWEMHEKEFEGRKLWCGPAQKKLERRLELWKERKLREKTLTNLYIKNFDEDLTEEKLRQYFTKEAYGEITSVKIADSSRCFGYISFETPQGTAIALNEMNGRPLPGSRKPLYVAYHEPKFDRRKKLNTQARKKRADAKSRSLRKAMAMYPYYSQYPVYPLPNPRRPNAWPAPHKGDQVGRPARVRVVSNEG